MRGISDYGTRASKKEEYRVAASLSAATFLKMFIEKGLVECFPYSLRVPESEKSELSSRNFYTQFDSISLVLNGIKEKLGIDLTGIDFGRTLTLADFESLCIAHGADTKEAKNVLIDIRENYFKEKYINYTYENDLRGLIPNWANEIKDILSNFSVDLRSSIVANVGIGNGLEAPYLFTEVVELIGIDVSKDMLKRAREYFPAMKTVHNAAEDLKDIRTASIDIYISLRTFQSSLFDIQLALREAQRVLRQKGIIVITIANGFVDIDDDKKKVIRGLLIPGTKRIVDKSAPRKLQEQIVEKLSDLGFESVGYLSAKTDINIWGQKP